MKSIIEQSLKVLQLKNINGWRNIKIEDDFELIFEKKILFWKGFINEKGQSFTFDDFCDLVNSFIKYYCSGLSSKEKPNYQSHRELILERVEEVKPRKSLKIEGKSVQNLSPYTYLKLTYKNKIRKNTYYPEGVAFELSLKINKKTLSLFQKLRSLQLDQKKYENENKTELITIVKTEISTIKNLLENELNWKN